MAMKARPGIVEAHCKGQKLLEAVKVLHLVEDKIFVHNLCLAVSLQPGRLPGVDQLNR